MTDKYVTDLKKRILDEMTVSYKGALEKNFDLAKEYVRITSEGHVEVLAKDLINGINATSLYLIGKLYAKEAGLCETDDASIAELAREMGYPENSIRPWLKILRDTHLVRQTRKKGRNTYHSIRINMVERVLRAIQEQQLRKHI